MAKPYKLYFFRLFLFNKWLCFFVFLFFAINFTANLVFPTEITPIYNWNLYSFPSKEQKEYPIIVVTYNKDKVLAYERTWNEPQKLLLSNTLNLFIALKADKVKDPIKDYYINNWLPRHKIFQKCFPTFKNYNDQEELEQYPAWFKSYLQQCVGEHIDSVRIYRKEIAFNAHKEVTEISSELIYTIR
jgi:hypothetical protein